MGRCGTNSSSSGADLAAVEEWLEYRWRQLLYNAISESTRRTYNSGVNKFLNFCGTFGYVVCPANESTLLKFIAFMNESLALSTVKTYLSAIRFLHLYLGFDNPFPQFPRIALVMKGLKRSASPPRKRLPVTPNLLLAILQFLDFKKYEDSMFWAATLVAFFGFLRVSEFTVGGSFDPTIHLALRDIRFDAPVDPEAISIWLKASKTDPFREGCSVEVGATNDQLCPVVALMQYMWMRGGAEGPMFVHKGGRPLSRGWFQGRLQNLLSRAGVSGDYTSHSLRIGAATSAAVLGVPDYMIKTMGRWASDAYKVYIRTPRSAWARTSASLSKASV